MTTGNIFAERFTGIGEGWRARRRRKRAGRAESGAPRATAAENTARGLSRLATDPAEGASLGGRRSHLRTSRTPPAISDPHATIGSDGRPDGLGREMGSQGYMHGIGEYLGAIRLAQNGSRLRSGPPLRWNLDGVAAASKSKSGRILPQDVDQNPIYLPCAHQSARGHQFPAMMKISKIGAAGQQDREG